MPLAIDDKALYAGLDKMLAQVFAGVEAGLADGATVIEADLQATTAHGDVTGATRASYRAFVIGGTHDGSAEASSGYQAAQSANPRGALKQDSGVVLGSDERGLLLTAYTNYQEFLETKYAGAHAALGPSLQAHAQTVTKLAAEGSRKALK